MTSPYRSAPNASRRAAPARGWRLLRAWRVARRADAPERRVRHALLRVARAAPSDFARLVHGIDRTSDLWPPEVAPAITVSAAQAIRALRGCSAEERDAVAQHLQPIGCRTCMDILRGFRTAPAPLTHTRTEGGPGGIALRGDAPSHAPAVRNPSPALGGPRW